VDVDRGDLIDAQGSIVVEIALFHPAVFQRDLAVKDGGQTIDDGALRLRLDGVGIDPDTAIDRAGDTLDRNVAVLGHRDLGDLRHVAAKHILHRHAAA
jgi:hypothetical protein